MNVWVTISGVYASHELANREAVANSRIIGPARRSWVVTRLELPEEPEERPELDWLRELARVAIESPDPEVREAAAERLMHPPMIYSEGLVDPKDLEREGFTPIPVCAGKVADVVGIPS